MRLADLRAKVLEAACECADNVNMGDAEDAKLRAEALETLALALDRLDGVGDALSDDAKMFLRTLMRDSDGSGMTDSGRAAVRELRELCA